MLIRLDKLLAHSGYGTRKEVKQLIRKGYVSVDDEIIYNDDYKVDTLKSEISFFNEEVKYEQYTYIMLNKPDGYVSATYDSEYPTVIDLVNEPIRNLFPIGRLDIDTEGLLLISNDGQLAHQLLSPKKHCPKVYYAKIQGVVTNDDVQTFLSGVIIDQDYQCQSAHLKILSVNGNESEIEVEIYEGKFHQIKKMFHAVGKEVTYLKRIRMKNLVLDESLELGSYRELTDEELDRLKSETVLQ